MVSDQKDKNDNSPFDLSTFSATWMWYQFDPFPIGRLKLFLFPTKTMRIVCASHQHIQQQRQSDISKKIPSLFEQYQRLHLFEES